MSDPEPGWTRRQRRLHAWVAGLVGVQAILAWPMGAAAQRLAEVERGIGTASGMDFLVTTLHTGNGLAVALLTAWRLRLRYEHRALAPRRPLWVRLHHALLYALVLAMSSSGALHGFAGVAAAAGWHAVGKWLLLVAVAVHVTGAVLHALPKRRESR